VIRRVLLLLAVLLVAPLPATAHVVLDAERARQLVADIARHRRVAQEAAEPGARSEATFALGETVETLVDRMNQELAAHGTLDLFAQLVLERLQAYAVGVRLSARTQRLEYDLAAFQEYLRRDPHGPHAADARFKLIARRFHAAPQPDPAALPDRDVATLLHAIRVEEGFLGAHPRHARADDVRFFLAVDYYRAARHAPDRAQRREYARRAREALTAVAAAESGGFEARAAQVLLESLRAR
jgi:hypothetical protein